MLQAQLGDAYCQEYPELVHSSIGELRAIFSGAMAVLTAARLDTNPFNPFSAIEAKKLHDDWRENWTPYQSIPGDFMTDKVVTPEIQERFCGLLVKTVALAERLIIGGGGAVVDGYDELVRAVAGLKRRVSGKSAPGNGGLLVLVGAVLVAGAVGVGLAHFRRRRPAHA